MAKSILFTVIYCNFSGYLPAVAAVQMVESSPCNEWAGVQTPVNHNVFHANNYSVNGNAIINCVNGNVVILQVHSFPVKVNAYFYLSMAKSNPFTVIYCNFKGNCQ